MAKRQKNNSKILYLLAGFLVFFGIFIYNITRDSELSKAQKDLETSYTKEEIKSIWNKYQSELKDEDRDDLLFEIRTKLAEKYPKKSDMEECKLWLPKAPESLNIIVIPDLSNRLTTIPRQKENDVEILNFIWSKFKKISIPKKQSNDILSIDLTDNEQLPGFQEIADNLVFNLSKEKKGLESNKRFFDNKGEQFSENINKLYGLIKDTKGADFVEYFKNKAKGNLKKSDYFNEYRNIFIILTDGYLETSNPFYAYTGNNNVQRLICSDIQRGSDLNQSFINNGMASISSKISQKIDLSDAEVLILEVNERPEGKKCHYDILKKFWQDWLRDMKVKNAEDDFFLLHEDATKKTINKLDDFLGKKYSYIDDTKERATEEVTRSSDFSISPTINKTQTIPKKNNPINQVVCNPQEISDLYKENIQRLANPSHHISTNIVLLRKENKQISLADFQRRLKNGELNNRKVYHVGVNPNCDIISIEIE